METTITLARSFEMSPLSLFDQNADDVIMLINFFLMKGDSEETKTQTEVPRGRDSFWDF